MYFGSKIMNITQFAFNEKIVVCFMESLAFIT